MAVAYGSSSSTGANDSLTTSIAVPVPSGVANTHHVYVAMEQWEAANPTVSNSHGFELVGQVVSGPQKLKVFCKLCSGADSGNYTFTWSGTQWTIAHAVRITGAKQVNNPTATAFNGATVASGTAIPNTSVTVGYIPGLLQFSCNENSATQTTAPTNFTEVQDSNYIHSNHRMNASASGTFTAPSGVMSASTLILAMLLAIEPASGGGSPINVNLGRATESETVNALGRSKLTSLGRSTVIDLGRGLVPSKLRPLSRVVQTDTARGLIPSKVGILTRAWSSDVAKALAASKMVPLSRVSELSQARPLIKSSIVPLGQVTETDSGRTLVPSHRVPFGRVIEFDTARTISPTSFQTVILGRVTEVSTVRALVPSKVRVLGRVIEEDDARDIRVGYRITLARAVEVEAARALGVSRFVLLPKVAELDTVRPLDIDKVVVLQRTIELNIAHELNPPPDTGEPVVDPGISEVTVEVSYGEVVRFAKTTSGMVVVTIVAERG